MHHKMTKTKSILVLAFLAFVFIGGIITSSCKKNACSGINCLNTGSCSNGKCTCPSGFTGTYCEIPKSAAYVGSYTGTDCYDDTLVYTITSLASNPYYFNLSAKATMVYFCGSATPTINFTGLINTNDTTSFVIVVDSVNDYCGNTWGVMATGTRQGNTLQFNWDAVSGSVNVQCAFAGQKN